MDSLKIQDVFEPYYAGRKRFTALKDKNLPAEVADATDRGEAGKRLLRRLLADAKTETDSTTEH